MDTIIWILYVFISCGNQRIFTSRDFIQQEVIPRNRKFMMKWDFPDESSDCHVISDELVFEVKFVSKVCQ